MAKCHGPSFFHILPPHCSTNRKLPHAHPHVRALSSPENSAPGGKERPKDLLAASRLGSCGWWNEVPLLEIQHQPPRSLGTFSAHVPAKSWRRWCPKGTDTIGLMSTAAAGPAGEPSSLAAAAARPSKLALPHIYGISPWICSCFFHPLPQNFMLSSTREPAGASLPSSGQQLFLHSPSAEPKELSKAPSTHVTEIPVQSMN